MIERNDIPAIAGGIAEVVRRCVTAAMTTMGLRVERLEKRIAELPAGPQGPKGDDGRDGRDGKDATVDTAAIIAAVVKEIPKPRDGKDAVVDVPSIVAEVKAQIPTPKEGAPGRDGKDGESVHRDTVALMVREAVEALPKPKDGRDGKDGEKGNPGERGEAGLVGPKGDAGPQGLPGKDGAIGPQGERGADGLTGPVGPAGERGERGERGEKGEKGIDGVDGKDGHSIHPDTVALMVQEAVEKAVQKAVAAIPKAIDGKDGAPGRDALDINPIPSIDETRNYPTGTWARHKGGLWRYSGAQWEVVVCGVADTIIEASADFRTFTIKTILSDGRTNEKTMTNPSMIYRGIFKAGESYQPGDCVTKDGSIFLCKSPSPDVPGTSENWQLIVKRGADGKSGRDGKNGPEGPQGPAGRDLRYQ